MTGSSGRPDMTASIAAVSAADRASGPTRSRPGAKGITPSRETSPSEGAIPTTPHCEAGSRIDPPVSVPTARGTNPAATAAALPPELPPGLRRRSTGLRVGPWDEVCVEAPIASSSMLARPSRIAPPPAGDVRRASAIATTSWWAREPLAVSWPTTRWSRWPNAVVP